MEWKRLDYKVSKKNHYDITKELSNDIFKILSNDMFAFFGELFWISERIDKKIKIMIKMRVTNHKKPRNLNLL